MEFFADLEYEFCGWLTTWGKEGGFAHLAFGGCLWAFPERGVVFLTQPETRSLMRIT
jgi:hypothetical protein